MKKIWIMLLITILCFTLCGCGNEHNHEHDHDHSDAQQNINLDKTLDLSRFSEIERDEDGNIIRTLEGERGSESMENFYNNKGVLVKEIVTYAEGSKDIRLYDENQTIIKETRIEANGMEVEVQYSSGIPYLHIIRNIDGTRVELTYGQGGVLLAEKHYDADGNLVDESNESQDTENVDNPNDKEMVITLNKDNWKEYLEEYTHITFVEDEERIIISRFFIVKQNLGTVDVERSKVELKYSYENRMQRCMIDTDTKELTQGAVIGADDAVTSDKCEMKLVSVNKIPFAYGIFLGECEVNKDATSFQLASVVDMEVISGTIYIEK